MSWLRMSEIAAMCGGELRGADAQVESVSTDSRSVNASQLFVALEGPNFDAHDFVTDELSAAGAIVSRRQNTALSQIVVADVLESLGRFAVAWRSDMPARVIGLTGSNGKTTVKEMCASILGRMGNTQATRGNLNNHIGVPLTLLTLKPEHDFAVIEMGANHAGEIASLAALARPEVGCVTNAGPAHLEGFGSVEGVARAKGEIFEALAQDGTAIINADDDFAVFWQELAGARRCMLFGFQTALDISGHYAASGLRLTTDRGEIDIDLQLPGRHNAQNALAAAACCSALGADLAVIKAGLEALQPVKGRLHLRRRADGVTVLDDTYNANPGSLAVALDVLTSRPGKHWVVLGDMGELGPDSERLHAEAGVMARKSGVERLFALGSLARAAADAFGDKAAHFSSSDDLVCAVQDALHPEVQVLIKGSRAMRMEVIVDALLDSEPANDALFVGNDDAA